MLLWLADMGADEIHGVQLVNRFLESPAPPRPAPAQAPIAAVSRTQAQSQSAAPDISIDALQAQARGATSLSELHGLLLRFDSHPLQHNASNLCFTGGAAQARVLVIADRPRNEEDRSGRVFADRHALLFERMLAAIDLRGEGEGEAEQVAMLSFVPWRPPGNRPPNELECRMILPFAERAIALLQPRLILAFGALPGQWLADGAESIQRQRGKWQETTGIPLIATFHPEALLKSPALKRHAWHDLLALRAKLDELA
jgi:uracil-DNA glycosylase family 4